MMSFEDRFCLTQYPNTKSYNPTGLLAGWGESRPACVFLPSNMGKVSSVWEDGVLPNTRVSVGVNSPGVL